MSNTIRTRKAPALIEDTGITWSVRCQRLAKTASVAVVFSALAACGVQNDAETLSNLAATQAMSIPVYQSKEDCDAAAKVAGTSLNSDTPDLNFSCDSVDTTKLANIEDAPANAGEPTSTALASNAAPATSTTPHSGGVSNPLMWYMLGNMMGNRSSVTSSAFTPSAGAPAPSAFINSSGNGKMSMSASQQFATPTPGQYAGLKQNGGVLKTGTIGSNLARAATYKSSTSSIGSKSSVSSSVGHSSGGRGGGSSGGGG